MRRVLLVLLIVGAAACGGDDDSASSDATTTAPAADAATSSPAASGQAVVDIADFAFGPADVEVAVGQELVWSNGDEFAHTAHSDDDEFDTGEIAPGATSDPVSFDEPGTYSYHCGIHNSMTGTVTVTG
jgi:plastocyanin